MIPKGSEFLGRINSLQNLILDVPKEKVAMVRKRLKQPFLHINNFPTKRYRTSTRPG